MSGGTATNVCAKEEDKKRGACGGEGQAHQCSCAFPLVGSLLKAPLDQQSPPPPQDPSRPAVTTSTSRPSQHSPTEFSSSRGSSVDTTKVILWDFIFWASMTREVPYMSSVLSIACGIPLCRVKRLSECFLNTQKGVNRQLHTRERR